MKSKTFSTYSLAVSASNQFAERVKLWLNTHYEFFIQIFFPSISFLILVKHFFGAFSKLRLITLQKVLSKKVDCLDLLNESSKWVMNANKEACSIGTYPIHSDFISKVQAVSFHSLKNNEKKFTIPKKRNQTTRGGGGAPRTPTKKWGVFFIRPCGWATPPIVFEWQAAQLFWLREKIFPFLFYFVFEKKTFFKHTVLKAAASSMLSNLLFDQYDLMHCNFFAVVSIKGFLLFQVIVITPCTAGRYRW